MDWYAVEGVTTYRVLTCDVVGEVKHRDGSTYVVLPWSAATAYVVDDEASLAGTTYICVLGHTNHTPPNGTYWTVVWPRSSTARSS
jgi:hypothetical protein